MFWLLFLQTFFVLFFYLSRHNSAQLRFQCSRPAGVETCDYHRLVWCPYIPDSTESTSSGSAVDDGSNLMMVTHDSIVSLCLLLSLSVLVYRDFHFPLSVDYYNIFGEVYSLLY